jgi:SHS2 domain-containing protein
MARFELFDHTADVGIVAYGKDLKEAYANVACGMFSLIADLKEVHEEIQRDIDIQSLDRESLVVDWLNELLYIFDVDHVIFSRFEITALSQSQLRAKAYGEKIDTSRHQLKTEVKAATYHLLKVEKGNGFKIQVILDI